GKASARSAPPKARAIVAGVVQADFFRDLSRFGGNSWAGGSFQQEVCPAAKSDYFLFLRLLFFFLDCPDCDMAIAIACLRLFTFLPDPLRKLPRFFSPMTL